jgi:hypothetical protein
MTNSELKQMLTDALVGRVYQRLGIPPSTPITSFIKAAATFIDNPDGTPGLHIVDPVRGTHFENAEKFGEALARDPDFKPTTQVTNREAAPRHVNPEDLNKEFYDLKDIATGKIIVDLPEPVPMVEVGKDQVSRRDQNAINRNIEGIASGKVTIAELMHK